MRPNRRTIHLATAALAAAGLATAALAGPAAGARPATAVTLSPIGTYASGVFDESAAEIVAFDPASDRLFVVNANEGIVDILDIKNPKAPKKVGEIVATGEVNSVAVRDGVVAVAVQADPVQDSGTVELFDTDGDLLAAPVTVGALPDMLTFTPDGTKIVVANEGEPDNYCYDGQQPDIGDPEGSISIIDVATKAVSTADFAAFNEDAEELRASGVRIFGPDATVAQDLEPEYVAIDADSTTAWVSLQENNAFAIVDLTSATVTDIVALGYKDHSVEGNALDASNRDGEINIQNWPVSGMYQPDAIDAFTASGETFLVTANEGDARDYECYSEEARIKDLVLDSDAFPDAEELQEDENLGRLNTTTAFPTPAEPVTELYSYGARSFSIRDASGALVFDSGDDFERITAAALPEDFNSNNDENGSFDARSDDKGPEPEGIEIGIVGETTFAFIGLERVGGIMVYDITDPEQPSFLTYVNNRNFDARVSVETGKGVRSVPGAGDLGPEGLVFIPADDSPTGGPLLAVGNEVSGTTTIYELSVPDQTP